MPYSNILAALISTQDADQLIAGFREELYTKGLLASEGKGSSSGSVENDYKRSASSAGEEFAAHVSSGESASVKPVTGEYDHSSSLEADQQVSLAPPYCLIPKSKQHTSPHRAELSY